MGRAVESTTTTRSSDDVEEMTPVRGVPTEANP